MEEHWRSTKPLPGGSLGDLELGTAAAAVGGRASPVGPAAAQSGRVIGIISNDLIARYW